MKKLVLILVCIVAFSFSLMAQGEKNGYNTGYGSFNEGSNGLSIGSTTNNTYSALVINGPGQPQDGSYTRDLVFKFNSAGTSIIRSYRGPSWDTYIQFLTTGYENGIPKVRMHITQSGYVGIGTINPASLLSVNGDIRAKGVIVDTGWADFVFEEDYELPSLDEIAEHIKEKKHLPGIPTTAEVEQNGVNLAEINVKLLQKIEELTLYTIQQQAEIKEMKEKMNELENKIK